MKKILLSSSTVLIALFTLQSCTREMSFKENETVVSDTKTTAKFKDKQKKLECGERVYTYAQLEAKGKRPTRPPKGPKNNNDTPPPPPPPPPPDEMADAVLYLDFDGYTTLSTSSWGVIVAQPSGMSAEAISDVVRRVTEDYSPFKVTVTTDEAKFLAARSDRRMRCVVGSGLETQLGRNGGIAYVGSLTWGTDDPCFVQADLLGRGGKMVGEAASHELGHTVGLRHQAAYDANCVKTADYNAGWGSGNIGFAPIMGVGYYQNVTGWYKGPNPYGCTNIQDDLAVITTYLPLRADDVPSTLMVGVGTHKGLIETPDDVDTYTLPTGIFTISLTSGGNTDLAVEVLNGMQVVAVLDDPTDLHVVTSLSLGTYSLRVRVSETTPYIPRYSMSGQYTLTIQ